ncbi:hypothetical protein O3P69_004352 [Scylla paramamosain]|uniref:Uncharacterized protein n=1 Tax=Scylla paramamosain TaxID=85552 RepID=A0AAW0UBQ2_SCYPA
MMSKQVLVLVANLGDEERQIPAGAAVGNCEAEELVHEAPGSGPKEMAVNHSLSHCSPRKERIEKCRRTVMQADTTGSYEHLEEAQREVPDISLILKLMGQDTNKPAWEEVAALSPANKHYWAQWESLWLGGGVLLKKWMTADGRICF